MVEQALMGGNSVLHFAEEMVVIGQDCWGVEGEGEVGVGEGEQWVGEECFHIVGHSEACFFLIQHPLTSSTQPAIYEEENCHKTLHTVVFPVPNIFPVPNNLN